MDSFIEDNFGADKSFNRQNNKKPATETDIFATMPTDASFNRKEPEETTGSELLPDDADDSDEPEEIDDPSVIMRPTICVEAIYAEGRMCSYTKVCLILMSP